MAGDFTKTGATGGGDGSWSPVAGTTLQTIETHSDGKVLSWQDVYVGDQGRLSIAVSPLSFLPRTVTLNWYAYHQVSSPDMRVGSVDVGRGFRLKDAAGTVVFQALAAGYPTSTLNTAYSWNLTRVYSGEIDSSGDWTLEVDVEGDPSSLGNLLIDQIVLSYTGAQCNFPSFDKLTTGWNDASGGTSLLWQSVDEDPGAAVDINYVKLINNSYNELQFGLPSLPEPGSVVYATIRGKSPEISPGVYAGIGVSQVQLRCKVGATDILVASSGTILNLWTSGTFENKTIALGVYEASRSSWGLTSDGATTPYLQVIFLDSTGSNSYILNFEVSAIEVCLTNGSGTGGGTGGGGGSGPGNQAGKNASFFLSLCGF